MDRSRRTIALLALLLTACGQCDFDPGRHPRRRASPTEPGVCGVERWRIKTLTDVDAKRVDVTHPLPATVEQLRSLAPPYWHEQLPRMREERRVYTVTARLQGSKLESDSDYHLVLEGDSGDTLVVEIPAANCAEDSPVQQQIADARQEFEALMGKRLPNGERRFKRLKKPLTVRVTGVAFFDKIHGQRGGAPNGIELHPVLRIELAR
jgi:hypothetical protein